MTQEDKELLLQDLSARLPYGLKVACNKNVYTVKGLDLIVTDEGDWEYAVTAKGIAPIEIDFIKPYLFPLSSMTEEQKKEMKSFDPFVNVEVKTLGDWAICLVKFYNKYHFDYNGLIPKGLAKDATGLNIY